MQLTRVLSTEWQKLSLVDNMAVFPDQKTQKARETFCEIKERWFCTFPFITSYWRDLEYQKSKLCSMLAKKVKISITCNGVQRTLIQQFVALEDLSWGIFDQMKEEWLCNFFFITLCCQNSDALVAKKQRIWKVSTWWKELRCNGTNWICSRL